MRNACSQFLGALCVMCLNPMTAEDAPRMLVKGSYERAWKVGHAVLSAINDGRSPVDGLVRDIDGSKCLLKNGRVSVYRVVATIDPLMK